MKKVYVGGIPYSVTKEALAEEFGQFGSVDEAVVITDHETGRSRGFGFVTFIEQNGAQAALAYDGKEWQGRKITVNMAKEKSASGGGRGGRSFGGGGRR